jgi:predicted metal-dependent peptidase
MVVDKEKEMNSLLIKFLFTEPFFADIIRSLNKIETNKIPTAGVTVESGTYTLYWNYKFLNSLNDKQKIGLMKHECYHLIFKHVTKRKQEPHKLWNIATDLAINSIIPLRQLPEGGLIPGHPLSFEEDNTLPEEFKQKRKAMSDFIEALPKDKSSEYYMEQLLNDPEMQDIIEEMTGGSNDGCGFDFHFDNNDLTDSERAIAESKMKKIVKDAVKKADLNKGWGSCSSEVREQIRTAISADEVNWKDMLRNFCGTKQKANKSRTFRRINRKYPYIHPGRKISHEAKIAIYIDQSGSVSQEALQALFESLNDLAKRTTFTIFHFDTTVDEKSRYEWKKRKKIKTAYRTRSGGTCFNCIEKFHRKIKSQFDGYIVFTDGEASKPIPCKTKRCWLLYPGKQLAFSKDKNDTVIIMKTKRR